MEQIVWKIGFEPMTSRVQGGETTTVIFPVLQIHFKILFRETVGLEIIHESLRSMRESNSQCLSDSQAGQPLPQQTFFVIPTGLEPVTLGLENPCSIQLSYGTLVIPERFELSTPSLKDQCSNHLSYEILFCNLRRIRTFNLRCRKPMLYPIEP